MSQNTNIFWISKVFTTCTILIKYIPQNIWIKCYVHMAFNFKKQNIFLYLVCSRQFGDNPIYIATVNYMYMYMYIVFIYQYHSLANCLIGICTLPASFSAPPFVGVMVVPVEVILVSYCLLSNSVCECNHISYRTMSAKQL